MTPAAGTIPPPITWAQRNDLLYVIIDAECKDIDHHVTENCFQFKGTNALDENKKYEVTLNFLKPVDPEKTTSKNIGRCIEYTIYKKETGPFWKSLTNDKTKLHFLNTNFAKWENESGDDEVDPTLKMFDGDESLRKRFDEFDYDYKYDSDDDIPSLSENDDEDDKKDEEKQDNEK